MVLTAGLKLVVVGQDRSDIAGRVEVKGRRQVDAVEGTHLDGVEPRGVLKPCTSEWSERDQRQELLGCRLSPSRLPSRRNSTTSSSLACHGSNCARVARIRRASASPSATRPRADVST